MTSGFNLSVLAIWRSSMSRTLSRLLPTARRWKVDQIERMYAVGGKLCEGTELVGRVLRNSEVESLLTPFAHE